MSQRLSVTNQWQSAAKRIVVCCGCLGLSFLAVAWFGLHQRLQASENTLPERQVSAAPTKIHPNLVASYGKLPLSFEANQGQVRGPAQFLSRGLGYMLLLTGDEAVLNLEKSAVVSGRSSVGTRQKPGVRTQEPEGNTGQGTTGNGPRTTDSVLRMKLIGANAGAAVTGMEELPGKSNYFIGNDPNKWRTNVPNYAKVRYQNVYPGVDLVYYGTQGGQLEYDFVVAPGGDAHSIGLSFQGAGKIRVDKRTGDLVLALAGNELRFRKPVVYQPTSGSALPSDRHAINGRFVLTGRNQIGFQVAAYDRRAPLIIDPVLIYSTYLGGARFNLGIRVAVDASGGAYVAGTTNSSDFPMTAGVFNSLLHSGGTCTAPNNVSFPCPDAFVTKLDPTGTTLVYSTYLGGSQADGATGISVDSSGNAYVTGATGSTDFPTTGGAFQKSATAGRAHAFATKLNATGSALIYSTYLGGSRDDGSTISALGSGDHLYVAGLTTSLDFPTTPGAFQKAHSAGSCGNPSNPRPCADGFIAKLNGEGSGLIYSTYLGGSNEGAVLGLAVDSAGSAYATGATLATDFPTAKALQGSVSTATCGPPQTPRPCFHAFVSKLDYAGTELEYSTYLAGNGGDGSGFGIAVDATGAAYVTGATNSTSFPTSAGAAQTTFGGGSCGNSSHLFDCPDAFVAKLNRTGSTLAYSTYLGGSSFDFGMAIAVDHAGNAYVVGGTDSLDFPTTDPIQVFKGGSCSVGPTYYRSLDAQGFSFDCPNAFLTKINPKGSALLFSTYLGGGSGDVAFGVAVDASGGTYVAGSTLSSTFPTANPFQPSMTGYADAFISKFGSPPTAKLSASALDFEEQVVGTTSVSKPVTLSNMGNAALTITSITASANFGETSKCGSSVEAGRSCRINVTFSPTETGPLTGTLTITDNSNLVAGSTQTVTLSGTGTEPVVGLSAPSLSFGNQSLSTTSSAQVETVTNTGTGNLAISTVTIGGTNPSDFATSADTCLRAAVKPTKTCAVNVTFTPSAAGSRSASLNFTDDASNSPQMVSLTGTGTGSNPVPTLSKLWPSSAAAGGAAFTLTVTGTNFVAASTVQWNATGLTTTYVRDTKLAASVPASNIATTGTASITVMSPTPGGGTSSGLTFTINNPRPEVTSLSPSSATAGGAAFTLTVTGTNFISSSTVQWKGTGLTTTYVSDTELTASVPASDIATAGMAAVTVMNPTPGGGTSRGLPFTIDNPEPGATSLSPSSAAAGGPAFTLTVTGTNFVSTSTVKWNKKGLQTTYVSPTQVTASVPATEIATAGTATVTVMNPTPGGGTSSGLTFTIN